MTTFAYFTSGYDWLIIAGIAVLLFGGTKLPQLAKGLGEGIREFKKSVNTDDEPTPPPPGPAPKTVETVDSAGNTVTTVVK